MAQKRMFDLAIVRSDRFLDMSLSTQALYFHLGMNADDDGFVSPKMIMRMLGSTQDELTVLITKQYIIPFNDGVVVIKDWKNNNLIRSDRYKPTIYQNHLKRLETNDSNGYELGIPEDNQDATDGIPSIGEYSIEENNIHRQEAPASSPKKPKQEINLTQEQLTEPLAQYKLPEKQLDSICRKEMAKIIEFINDAQGRKLSPNNTKGLNNYKKIRLEYGKADIIKSINNAHDDPFHVEKKYQYLTAEFLFRQDKFEKFLF